jgi:hypothetical protein
MGRFRLKQMPSASLPKFLNCQSRLVGTSADMISHDTARHYTRFATLLGIAFRAARGEPGLADDLDERLGVRRLRLEPLPAPAELCHLRVVGAGPNPAIMEVERLFGAAGPWSRMS